MNPATRPWVISLRRLILDAWESLSSRPFRTLAMVAGIVLGVGSATAAVLVADTQQNQIDRRFDLQRSSWVVIQAQTASAKGFDPESLRALRALEPVTDAGEFTIWAEAVSTARTPYAAPGSSPLIVSSSNGLQAAGVTRVSGADLALLDRADSGLPLVWLGETLAVKLGVAGSEPASVVVGGVPYTVAGVVRNTGGFDYVDSSVVMSRALAAHDQPGPVSVRALAHVRPGSAAAVGRYALASLDPEQEQELVDVTAPDGEILLSTVASDMRTIGLALGAFVGLVGMIAVANTLMMSVHQRRRELGLRSAMGWSRGKIAALILTESAVAGAVAALVGAALGMLCATIWCLAQGWQLIVARELGPVVIIAGTAASLLGGVGPALRAASVSPMTALRD